MKKIFTISLVGMILLSGISVVFAGHPCAESKQIWRDRLIYDAAVRKKRGTMKRQLAAYRIQDAELDEAMGRVEEMILVADSDAKEEDLWTEYNLLDEKRNTLRDKRMAHWNEYYKLTTERSRVKTKMKKQDLQKHYECVVNDTLNGKLGDLTAALEKSKYSPADVAEFKALTEKRRGLIKSVEASYEKYQEKIDGLGVKILDVAAREEAVIEEEFFLDEEAERLYTDLYDEFHDWRAKLKDYSAELAKTSEELMHFTEVLK